MPTRQRLRYQRNNQSDPTLNRSSNYEPDLIVETLHQKGKSQVSYYSFTMSKGLTKFLQEKNCSRVVHFNAFFSCEFVCFGICELPHTIANTTEVPNCCKFTRPPSHRSLNPPRRHKTAREPFLGSEVVHGTTIPIATPLLLHCKLLHTIW